MKSYLEFRVCVCILKCGRLGIRLLAYTNFNILYIKYIGTMSRARYEHKIYVYVRVLMYAVGTATISSVMAKYCKYRVR